MKRSGRNLAALLAAVLTFCALPVPTGAVSHNHDSFTELSEIKPDTVLAPGNYYLTQDIDVLDSADKPADWKLDGDYVICLNGHSLNYSVLSLRSGSIEICNCGDPASIGPVYVEFVGSISVFGNVSVKRGSRSAAIDNLNGTVSLCGDSGTVDVEGIRSDINVTFSGSVNCPEIRANGYSFLLSLSEDFTSTALPIHLKVSGSLSETSRRIVESKKEALPGEVLTVELSSPLKQDFWEVTSGWRTNDPNADDNSYDYTLSRPHLLRVRNWSMGTVTATVGSSSYDSLPLNVPFSSADTVTLSAVPYGGYEFAFWEFPYGVFPSEPDSSERFRTENTFTDLPEQDIQIAVYFIPVGFAADAYTQVGSGVQLGVSTSESPDSIVWTPADDSPQGEVISGGFYEIPAANITTPGAYTYTAAWTQPITLMDTFDYDYPASHTATLYVNGITDPGPTEFMLGQVRPDPKVAYGTPMSLQYSSDGVNWSYEVPDAVGTWMVKVTVPGWQPTLDHIPPLEAVYEITVIPDRPVITADPEAVILSGGAGSSRLTVADPPTGGSYQWFRDGEPIPDAADAELIESYSLTDAGSHTYVCKITAGGETVESSSVTVTVRDENTVTDVILEGWEYTAVPNPSPIATSTYGTPEFRYASAEGGPYGTEVPTEAGDYWVKAFVAAGDTYTAAESAPTKFTITRVSNVVGAVQISDRYYGEAFDAPTVTCRFGTPQFYYAPAESGPFSTEVPTAVGEYWVKAVVPATASYDQEESPLKKFSILKSGNSIGTVKLEGWGYGETPKTPTVDNCRFGIPHFLYASAADGTYVAEVPTAVGDHWVKAVVAATDDYDAVESAPVKFTIDKGSREFPKGLVAADETVGTLHDGKIDKVTAEMEYRLISDENWKSCPNGTLTGLAPGEYLVRYKATDNYYESPNANVTIKAGGPVPESAQLRCNYVPLTTLPYELTNKYGTPKDLENEMLAQIKSKKMGGKSPTGYQFWDITLEFYSDTDKAWHLVTGEIFPAKGVFITLPYPNGTTATNSKFYAAHVFTYGNKAGIYEFPDVTAGNSLQMAVFGTSPLMLAYATDGSTNTTPTNNTGSGGSSSAVPTGDTNNPQFWGVLLLVGTAGLSTMLALPALKKHERKKHS